MQISNKTKVDMTAEGHRMSEAEAGVRWRRWGPYLADRQWGTVREDYSSDGDAWRYFTHDHARSRAYRWGEDAIGGFTDEAGRWCLAPIFWNGADPFVKERLFGVTNGEGNHGEDVKEVYHYVDATPTHSYQKMSYRYPQEEFPYEQLVRVNRERSRSEPEYEIHDTGIFDEGRFFDIVIEYAKASPDDVLMRITVQNRGPEPASIWVAPQLWARNTWSWGDEAEKPEISATLRGFIASRPGKASWRLDLDAFDELVLCDNVTNTARLFGSTEPGPFKDGINDYLVEGREKAISRDRGTKAAAISEMKLGPGKTGVLRARWRPEREPSPPFQDFDGIFDARIREADEFFAALQAGLGTDTRAVHRQAIAGLLWSKQFYYYDVPKWLAGDPGQPEPPVSRHSGRNAKWQHLNNADVVLMPDKWEYPWYASWDLAFQCVALATVDAAFAKDQLVLLTRDWYMHPNGQLPAYEWDFGDANPPVHAWAALQVYRKEKATRGVGDLDFLERVLHKLSLNFTWWVNRRDDGERNLFQGGFLGLDNISPFNRSEQMPDGSSIDQADGTAWMAMYALNLMAMSIELALERPVYEDLATKFFEHFLSIAAAMSGAGGADESLWDEQDGFFYDVVRDFEGALQTLRLRSMVGLIPLFAVEVIGRDVLDRLPNFSARMKWFLRHRPVLASLVSRWDEEGPQQTYLLSVLRGHRLKSILRRALDPGEFLSEYGIRSLSRSHFASACQVTFRNKVIEVSYQPGESTSALFGGNSNWRGPIWMPVNYLLLDALRKYHSYFGSDFRVEMPFGSGKLEHLGKISDEIAARLLRLFVRGEHSQAAAMAAVPAVGRIKDGLLFYEYFDGDTGHGLGASHQTGWTALAANIIEEVAAAERRTSAE